MAWPLVPLAKYDSRYAAAIGKWMLNTANAARFCYPYEIDDAHQWLPAQKDISKNVIAYEGIRKADDYGAERLKGVQPVALGDGPKWIKGQPEVSMLSLYSSAQVGIYGAIIRKTNVDRILQLDCNATDFYQRGAYPTYLYYNPYDSARDVVFYYDKPAAVDLYDALTQETVAANLQADQTFTIPPKAARLLVVLPAGSHVRQEGSLYAVDKQPVAYTVHGPQKP
jgi:hypothetical protein